MESFRRKHRIAVVSALSGILLLFFLFLAGLFLLSGKILGRIAGEISSRIGHSVAIGDFSLGFPPSLDLYHITVRDSDSRGTLLSVGKLTLVPDIPQLFRGEMRVKEIGISAPELSLRKDRRGKWNISEALQHLLSRKSNRTYRVDRLRIQSGRLSLHAGTESGTGPFNVKGIQAVLNNITSLPGARTSFQGSFVWENAGTLSFEGWFSLQKTGRDFSLSLHAPRLAPSILKEPIERYGGNARALNLTTAIKAEGNTTQEIRLTAEVQAKTAALPFLRTPLPDVLLRANARFNVPGDALILESLLLSSGNVIAVRADGAVRNISKKPSYQAALQIGKIDLSALSLPGGVRTEGSITSGPLRISGESGSRPRIEGVVHLDGGPIRTEKIESERVTAQVILPFPAGVSLTVKGLRFGNSRIPWLSLRSSLSYDNNILMLSGAEFRTEAGKADAKLLKGVLPNGKETLLLEATGVDGEKDGGKTAIRKGDFSLAIKNLSPSPSGSFTFSASSLAAEGFGAGPLSGSGLFDSEGLSLVVPSADVRLTSGGGEQKSLKGVSLRAKAVFKGAGAELAGAVAVKKISATFSGTMEERTGKGWTIAAAAALPETKAADIREALWDIFPDRFLYAGLDGSLASTVSLRYGKDGLVLRGHLTARDLVLTGENDEFALGPVQGTLPLVYGGAEEAGQTAAELPAFEKAAFDSLVSRYGQRFDGEGFSRITFGSFRYGFDLLNDITLWVRPEGGTLNIGRFSATLFGGKVYGAASVDMSAGLSYRAGFLVKGLSLTSLGDTITPVKGYVSGKVDGTGTLKGAGASLARLIGKADFWTYREGGEKMVISKEFLRQVGGPSLKAYLTDRSYDTGVMGLYLQNGYVVFRELEISNTNLLGIRDLSVQVAPLNNRIAIDHLLWTLTEAAQRAKEKQ